MKMNNKHVFIEAAMNVWKASTKHVQEFDIVIENAFSRKKGADSCKMASESGLRSDLLEYHIYPMRLEKGRHEAKKGPFLMQLYIKRVFSSIYCPRDIFALLEGAWMAWMPLPRITTYCKVKI